MTGIKGICLLIWYTRILNLLLWLKVILNQNKREREKKTHFLFWKSDQNVLPLSLAFKN